MPFSPQSSQSTRRFRFDALGQLYSDVKGRRVVTDFEGSGRVMVLQGQGLSIVLDGQESEGEVFSEYCTVIAPCGQTTDVAIVPVDIPELQSVEVELPYMGSGWLVATEKPLGIDGMREPVEPLPEIPVPFFRSLDGIGAATVSPGNVTCVEIQRVVASGQDHATFRVQNMSEVSNLEASFSDGSRHIGRVASHLNAMSWECSLPYPLEGMLIEKLYDRFHGRQRARVLLDDQFVGWWYEPVEDRTHRWAWARFGIAKSFLANKPSVKITIDPPAGTPLWSFSEVRVFGLKQTGPFFG